MNLEYYLERARKAEACNDALNTIRACGSIEEAGKHPRAPSWAYWYAHKVVKGRWPEGEPAIMRSAEHAYYYALYVLQERWPEGEPVIAQSAEWAYRYARDVVKDRWPEGEPAILRSEESAECAYRYARDVVQGRWPEGEPVIMQSEALAYCYAVIVLRGSGAEGEYTITPNTPGKSIQS